jgi:hypothetical protein
MGMHQIKTTLAYLGESISLRLSRCWKRQRGTSGRWKQSAAGGCAASLWLVGYRLRRVPPRCWLRAQGQDVQVLALNLRRTLPQLLFVVLRAKVAA